MIFVRRSSSVTACAHIVGGSSQNVLQLVLIGFNGAETNCKNARILDRPRYPTDERLPQLDIYRTYDCVRGFSPLNWFYKNGSLFSLFLLKHIFIKQELKDESSLV